MKRLRYVVFAAGAVVAGIGVVAYGKADPAELQALLQELSAAQAKLVVLRQSLAVATQVPLGDLVPARRGERGSAVIAIQKYLIGTGDLDIGKPTGYFGPLTEAALKKLQARKGIPVTGAADALTIAAITGPAQESATLSPPPLTAEPVAPVTAPISQPEPAPQTPAVTPVVAPELPPISPIGQWRFDGSGNNEVTAGPVAEKFGDAFFQPSGGRYGGYAYIKGAKEGVPGAVRIAHQGAFHLPTAFTVEFWFRQRQGGKVIQNLIAKGSDSNYSFRVFREPGDFSKPGAVVAGYTEAGSGAWKEVRVPNELTYGAWHHVAFTKSATGRAYYLDGAVAGAETIASPDARLTTSDIVLGEGMDDTDFDNLRIYNYALSAGQVAYIYQATSPIVQAPPTVEEQLASIVDSLNILAAKVAALLH